MSENYSSSPNASSSPCRSCTPTNMFDILYECMISEMGQVRVISYIVINTILLLPLCISVLYLGLQQWWQQRTSAPMNHIDAITYNMIISELLNIIGVICSCFAAHTKVLPVAAVGISLHFMNLNGQMLFQTIVCMERYLAVVHPITYLSLRKANGVRIRNIAIMCIWLFNCIQTGFMFINLYQYLMYLYGCMMTFYLAIVSVNSLYVLCTLRHSGPGNRSQLDQSKRKAFCNMACIVGVLLVRFVGQFFITIFYVFLDLEESGKCNLLMGVLWLSLPTSLPLPLLFMHRVRKLRCCINGWKLCRYMT